MSPDQALITPAGFILAAICIAILLRILFFDRSRAKARFKIQFGLIAWLMIVAFGSVAILILSGRICISGPLVFLIPLTMLLCVALFKERGNIAGVYRLFTGEH